MNTALNFRKFNNVKIAFSCYDSGNIKLELYSGDIRLCEITTDLLKNHVSENIIVIKKTSYADEIIKLLMWEDYIKAYTPRKIKGDDYYICMLKKNHSNKDNRVANKNYAYSM